MSEGDVPSRLPEGWAWATLGEVAQSVKNGVFVSRPGIEPNGIPILRIGAVRPLKLNLSDLRYSGRTEEDLRKADGLALPEDLLFTRYNGNPEFVGACAIVPNTAPLLAYPDKLIRVRVDQRCILPSYVAYIFSWRETRIRVRGNLKTTAGQVGISGSELKNIAFPVPPLAEQRSIVAALEEQFSRLDAAEVSLADATRRTSLVIRSVLNQFFTSSATRARGWQLEHLENVAEIRGGQTPRKDSVIFHTEWSPGFFPFWKVGDMNGADGRLLTRSRTYLSPDQAQDARVRIHPAGTVVIPKRGGAISTNKKRVTATAGAFDLNTMGIIPKGRLVPEFLWYWFQTINLQDLADGSNVPQINRPDLSHLQVPVPSESEQRSVVQHLDSLFAHMDRAQGMAVTVRPHLLRQALLGKAFTGHLVPQDPSNEPAEAMLAQIRVERGAAEASKLRRGSPRCDAQRKRDTSSAPDVSPPPPATSLSIPAVASQPALDLEFPS